MTLSVTRSFIVVTVVVTLSHGEDLTDTALRRIDDILRLQHLFVLKISDIPSCHNLLEDVILEEKIFKKRLGSPSR